MQSRASWRRRRTLFFGIFTDSSLACHFCVEKWGLPLRRVVYLPVLPFQKYPRILSAFDVALAPLKNDVFNRCKSSLRLLEYGAWGVPYVASKVAPYWRFHRETGGQAGLIAANASEFAPLVVRLLQDPDERRQRGGCGLKHVREEHDLRRTMAPLRETLLDALRAVRKRQRSPLRRPSFQAAQDAWKGIPKLAPGVQPPDAPCPCGSGETYANCPHGCAPAFGSQGEVAS